MVQPQKVRLVLHEQLKEVALDMADKASISALLNPSSISSTFLIPVLAISLILNIFTIGYILLTVLNPSNR
jgi:hypothetical protein